MTTTQYPENPWAERASIGMMAVFVIGLFMMLFIWILCGGVMERTEEIYTTTANLGGAFPVSDERTTTYNFMVTAFDLLPLLGIFLPLIIYAMIMSVRKGSGGI